VQKFQGKPFALIGVNVAGDNVKQLKQVMDKQNLTWRTFADPGGAGSGAIAASWNLVGTPTLYILDHNGVIRHKWVGSPPGEKAIDRALDHLIKAAESSGQNPGR
jgi:peroxiredoxin